ncbi:MAG: hypothetical protein IPK62_14320 [Bacteroidetes bacterium]|nr:hypothetical protein [Bacteroidota bacterium]
MKNIFAFLLLLGLGAPFYTANAQGENLDKIVAIVGDKIILRSEIDAAFEDYKRENPSIGDSIKCQLMEQTLLQKF